jgi:putative hydrolase of the HAD superfamily
MIQLQIKAVFFDLFETLVTEFAEGRRISKRSYDYQSLLGISSEDFKKEWGSRQGRRMNGEFENFLEVVKDIVVARDLPVNDEAIQHLYQERVKEKAIPFSQVRPEITEMLDRLHGRVKIGLISNCTEEEVGEWPQSALAGYFGDCVFSYAVQCSKPDSAIYELACSRLGVEPGECLFIGDGGSNELAGAAAAGLRAFHAVWFNSYVQSDLPKLASPRDVVDVVFGGSYFRNGFIQ